MRASDQPDEQQAAGPTGIMDRTFAVLELLAANPGGLIISAIAERLAIPLSATHRLLGDLAQRGYVRQERGYGAYQPTTKMVTLAFTYLAASGITDIAQPILDRLAAATGELVRLTVLDGDRLTWVAKAQGAQSGLRYDPETGNEVRLSCSSAGIAWLASMPDAQALALVARQGYAPRDAYGPKAPQTPNALLQHLRATRRRGYSVTTHTFTPWMAAMAALVRHGPGGDVRGTVSIAGPSFRLSEARMHELGPRLLAAAAELSEVSVASPALGQAHAQPGPLRAPPG